MKKAKAKEEQEALFNERFGQWRELFTIGRSRKLTAAERQCFRQLSNKLRGCVND